MQIDIVTSDDLVKAAHMKAGFGDQSKGIGKEGEYEASTLFDIDDPKVVKLLNDSGFFLREKESPFNRRDTWSVKSLGIVDTQDGADESEGERGRSIGLYMFSEDHPKPDVLKDPYEVDPFGIFAPRRRVHIGLTGRLYLRNEEEIRCLATIEIVIDRKYRGRYDLQRYSSDVPDSKHRLYKVLAESDLAVITPGMRELARNDGKITWNLAALGFPGAKGISALFKEFARENKNVFRLAEHGDVFDPKPAKACIEYYRENRFLGRDNRFVVFEAQSRILRDWRKQLKEYRDSLSLKP